MKKVVKGPRKQKLRKTASSAAAPKHAKSQRSTGDWRTRTLSRIRTLIMQADPTLIEERKWRKPSNAMAGIPVWQCPDGGGLICTGETYKSIVKVTFVSGAALEDPANLFNSSLAGNTRRAIDIHEDDSLDEKAFQALIRAAVALNTAAAKTTPAPPRRSNRPGKA